MKELKTQCSECDRCPLAKTKKNTVFGAGRPDADVMLIGEAPGASEDEQGLPFVGAAGQLLDRYFEAVGIDREQVYIANMLKCRPPRNRDPLPEEKEACFPYLKEQIRQIDPGIIVCLGRISAERLIGGNFRITRDHGKWYQKGKFQITAVYHPSLLLRDPSRREEMLDDLMQLRRKMDEMKYL